MSLTSKFSASISFRQIASPDLGSATDEEALSVSHLLAGGTANGQADLAWSDQRSLASNTSENLDFAGVLHDAYGAVITAAELCALMIEADIGNTTNITIGAAASNTLVGPFADATDAVVLKPGDCAAFYSNAGWTVTPSTGDILKAANSTGAVGIYRVAALGRSA